ncbi:MAG: SusE domain-containing protein [Gracilimonas sp.]|uniref:SusE domain-containing protein n=1 Tax=Gracilimonas sp. TaxID=1974203 RepID=UPI00199AED91|nr:SusE domain-containing protein [Gracilimonas sp.]MBD3615943.1 SusE domain-containing protein [Gracilimonas sp.]
MKKLILLVFTIAGLAMFASCEDNVGPTLSTNIEPPSFTNAPSGDSFVLTEETSDEVVLELEWSKPGVGFRAAANYVVEIAEAGTEFADPFTLAQTSSNSLTMTVGDLNSKMLTAGYPANVASDVEIRIKTEINDDVDVLYSEAVSLTVSPFYIEINYPEIYVPGGYQSASGYGNDWTPEDAPPLTSLEDNGQYEGYVNVANANELKFTEERSWDVNYGDDGADGTLEQNAANIQVTAGYYKINVNLNTLTYTMLNTTWGVIGDATPGGWGADTDMTYDPVEKTWSVDMSLSAGEMKFRANDAWDLDYGDNEGDGFLDQGGGNIAVPASGNYTVILNLGEAPYTYELIQN